MKEESNEEPVEEGPIQNLVGYYIKDLADQPNAQVSQVITKLISLGDGLSNQRLI